MTKPLLAWTVGEEDAGERLDRHLARRLDHSRHQIQGWIADGRVHLNGARAKASRKLEAGEEVVCRPPEESPDPRLVPEDGPLHLLHEDDHLVILHKPPGIAIHPGAGRERGTLANYLLARYPEMAAVGGPGRPGIVHRLDLDTTGVLAVARSELAYRRLSTAFAERTVKKTYQAIGYGSPSKEADLIDLPIGRHRGDRKKMAVRRDGRPARTHYRRVASAAGLSRFELDLETGRTHQIRVHLKAIGHPLVGDPVYGEARWRNLERAHRKTLEGFPRPALHAWRLALQHPGSDQPVAFEAPVPEDMKTLWQTVAGHPWQNEDVRSIR